MKNRIALVAAVVLAVTSCSDGAPSSDESTVPPTPSATTATNAPSSTTSAASSTTTTTTTTAAPIGGLAAISSALTDSAAIEVMVTGTHRPRFEWSSGVPLDRVVVVVTDGNGDVSWAWGGEGDSVTVGGGEVDRDGIGAHIGTGGWVQVIGYDASGEIVALSDPTRID